MTSQKKTSIVKKYYWFQVWTQMSFAPGTKVWDVKGQMQKLIMGWQKTSGDSQHISPWNDEHFPMRRKGKHIFSCVMKRYEKSLVGWNGWMRRWPMRNSHASLDKRKSLANTFPSVTWRRINRFEMAEMGRWSKSIFQDTLFPGVRWINYWRGIDWLRTQICNL
jgi:hypothetical protein